MKYLNIVFLLLFGLLWCCDDVERGPITKKGFTPQQVTNVNVVPIPGGAKIIYELPNEPDLLYIEALYTLPSGEVMKMNSSFNSRSIIVEGFSEVKEYQVALTSINRAGDRSDPYIVRFIPDKPPVIAVFESLKMQADFGGVNIVFKNPTEADLAFIISKKDEVGDEVNIDTYYTSDKDGSFSIRGMEAVEGEFSVKIRDKWNNYSDVKTEVLTPIYEIELDYANFKGLGAEYFYNVTDWQHVTHYWDDNRDDCVFDSSKTPWYSTFEIGPKAVRLSRVVFWQYSWSFNNYGHYYAGGNGKYFEIYGSNNPTTDMEGWTLLKVCEIVKPSGLPVGTGRDFMSNEDFDLAHNNGHEFIIPLDAPSVRYLRVRSLSGFEWNLGTPSELDIYGDPR